jgi:hypothetical protein
MPIDTNCYVAVMKNFHIMKPNAYYEIITRQKLEGFFDGDYILSPSWKLLKTAKVEMWSFEHYAHALMLEWGLDFRYAFTDTHQVKNCFTDKLWELQHLALSEYVYLVCFEKSKFQCHREIIKALLSEWTPNQILENIQGNHDKLYLKSKVVGEED